MASTDLNSRIDSPLITPGQLEQRLGHPAWVVIDVSTDLHDAGAGRRKWLRARIPGSMHLDLDRDLSAVSDPTQGRHPLPAPEAFAERLRRSGIGAGHKIAVYDDVGGAIAARLWWMMRWLRGLPVAVIDGGLRRWQAEGRAVESGPPDSSRQPAASSFGPHPAHWTWVSLRDVRRQPAGWLLLDARDKARFQGVSEPIDPRAGHIPGAIHASFEDNLIGPDRRFASARALFERFAALGACEASAVVCYCGSGVTACHNLLALELAGIRSGRLFVGSWSQWCHAVPPSAAERASPTTSFGGVDRPSSTCCRAVRSGAGTDTFTQQGG